MFDCDTDDAQNKKGNLILGQKHIIATLIAAFLTYAPIVILLMAADKWEQLYRRLLRTWGSFTGPMRTVFGSLTNKTSTLCKSLLRKLRERDTKQASGAENGHAGRPHNNTE